MQYIVFYDKDAAMNIKQLEVFVSIADSGSFSRGAEAACITQSTVSQHIAALEGLCGVRLFDRSGRGAVPTEAGKIMLSNARRVLKALKETEQALLQFRQADGIELAVGGSSIPGTYLLPQAIAALRATAPGVRVKVEIGDSREILEKLMAEEIEIGIIGTAAKNPRLSSRALGHDEILLIARQGHPWCGRHVITPEDLLKEAIVVREAGSGTHAAVDAALRKHGVKTSDLKISATLSSSEAIKQAILADCGVAFISEMAVRKELQQGELVSIRLKGIAITRSFSLVHRKGRTLSPAGEVVYNMLRQMKL